jgi:5-dehydro-2-deoxygluconokinase
VYDVLTMGRVGVDVYPLQAGISLAEVKTFGKFLGGSATNVAVAAARHGRKSAVITRTGDDPFGRFVHMALTELGVDDAFVTSVPGLPTPVTFCEIFPPDNFPLWFYRYPKAPDLEIKPEELDLAACKEAGVFWATVTGLSEQPSRDAHFAAWATRGGSAGPGGRSAVRGPPPSSRWPGTPRGQPLTVLDLDYRPMFWASRAAAREQIAKALPHVTVAVGNLDEAETAVGETDPVRAARALLDRGIELAVIKQGPGGVLAMTADEVVTVPPLPITVLNGIGAGDGFGGALCHGLLASWPLARTLAFANAAGAIVASRLECSTAMPTTAEVEALLGEE